MNRRTVAGLLAALVVLATLTAAAIDTADAAGPRLELDADNPLNTDAAINEYEREGVVSRDLSRVALTLTVADSHDKADIGGVHADTGRTFVCFDYQEGLSRTIRVYFPDAYAAPRSADLDPLRGDGPTATVAPVRNGSMTALTITFEQAGRSCYALGILTGKTTSAKSWVRDLVGNATGISLPSLSGGSDAAWTHVNGSDLVGDEAYDLPAHATVQMDVDRSADRSWAPVPTCEDLSEQTICQLDRANATQIMTATDTPPDIRYRTTPTGPIEEAQAIAADAMQAARQAWANAKQQFAEVF